MNVYIGGYKVYRGHERCVCGSLDEEYLVSRTKTKHSHLLGTQHNQSIKHTNKIQDIHNILKQVLPDKGIWQLSSLQASIQEVY